MRVETVGGNDDATEPVDRQATLHDARRAGKDGVVRLARPARIAFASAGALAAALSLSGGRAAPKAANFTAQGDLQFPDDYRRWIFLTSGHGMTYNPSATPAADPDFDNVFADPASYDAFLKTGHWPEGTTLVLEVRGGTSRGSINQHGAFQTTKPPRIEVHVRDAKRFAGGWGFFAFDGHKPAPVIAQTATCYSCHREHAAVDTTFVQFYPTLLPVATAKGSFSAAYVAEEKAAK